MPAWRPTIAVNVRAIRTSTGSSPSGAPGFKVRWTRLVLSDSASAQSCIAAENPQAAMEIARRIRISVRKRVPFPYMGRPGDDLQRRDWRVHRTPYPLVYRFSEKVIETMRVWHDKREPQLTR